MSNAHTVRESDGTVDHTFATDDPRARVTVWGNQYRAVDMRSVVDGQGGTVVSIRFVRLTKRGTDYANGSGFWTTPDSPSLKGSPEFREYLGEILGLHYVAEVEYAHGMYTHTVKVTGTGSEAWAALAELRAYFCDTPATDDTYMALIRMSRQASERPDLMSLCTVHGIGAAGADAAFRVRAL